MSQLGHTDAQLTLNLYAQVKQRQRVDEGLTRQLTRLPDEPEEKGPTQGDSDNGRLQGRVWAEIGSPHSQETPA